MTCELINPRTDGPRVMKQLYDALKNKPCECQREWTSAGYMVVKECAGHIAMNAYEALTMVSA